MVAVRKQASRAKVTTSSESALSRARRPPGRSGTDPRPRIVVGVDGSDGSTKAVEWAAVEAERTGAILELHASGYGFVYAPPSEVKGVLGRFLDDAVNHVEKVANGVVTKRFTHEGSPVSALIKASKSADLVVVGSRGLGGFSGLMLGSVSQQVSAHAHCPVAIIR